MDSNTNSRILYGLDTKRILDTKKEEKQVNKKEEKQVNKMNSIMKELEIQFFQGHKNTLLKFVPGLNIIKGTSHGGKSSIIRNIRWNLLNKLAGVKFKSWFAEKKDKVMSRISFSDSVSVSRERKGEIGAGEYHTGKLTYKAMGREVPPEIKELLQMDEINIQAQHERHFLLGDKPREVAKRLNALVGLDIIEEITSNINGIINRAQRNETSIKQSIKEKKEDLEGYEGLDIIEKMVEEVELLKEKHYRHDQRKQAIESCLYHINIEKEKIRGLEKKLQAEQVIQEIEELFREKTKIKERGSQIKSILDGIQVVRGIITRYETIIGLEEDIKMAITLSKQKIEKGNRMAAIKSILSNISNYRKRISSLIEKETSKEQQYKRLLIDLKICPVCGSEIKEEKIGRAL